MKILFILIFSLFPCITLTGNPDTVSAYKMGGIERIDGLLYGSEHTLVLFSDSTFTYHTKHGNQISTSGGIYTTGKWKLANDTLSLVSADKIRTTARFFNSVHNEYRNNSVINILLGECIACSGINEITVYRNDSSITMPVYPIQELATDKQKQLKSHVPYLKANVQVSFSAIDSLRIGDMVMVVPEKNLNEIGLNVYPAFNIQFKIKGADLQLISTTLRKVYRFKKFR